MDEHCAIVARRLEAIALRVDHAAQQLASADEVRWLSTAAQRYRDELADVSCGVRAGAEQARDAAAMLWRHAAALESAPR